MFVDMEGGGCDFSGPNHMKRAFLIQFDPSVTCTSEPIQYRGQGVLCVKARVQRNARNYLYATCVLLSHYANNAA